MTALLWAAALSVAAMEPAAPVKSVAPAPLTFSPSTPTPSSSTGTVLAGGLLAALAGAAFFFSRRQAQRPRFVHVLDTASLGPRRSLVVAQVNGETLLLGVSEAGIALLHSRPASAEALAASDIQGAKLKAVPRSLEHDLVPSGVRRPEPKDRPSTPLRSAQDEVPSLRAAPSAPAFSALLAESADDQELRRKLSAGFATRTP